MKIRHLELKTGLPKICVPIVAKDMESFKTEIDSLKNTYYDLIEWRIDLFEEVENQQSLIKALEYFRQELPDCVLLVTFRTIYEGGNKTTEYYKEIYETLIQTNMVDILDIEYSRGEDLFIYLRQLAHQYQVKVLASYHDFSSTPSSSEMMERFKQMQILKADIFKMALMPKTIQDVLNLLQVTYTANEHFSQPIVSMSMAKLGFISRTSGEIFGSAITFGSGQNASAPGQLNANKLHDLLLLMHEGL